MKKLIAKWIIRHNDNIRSKIESTTDALEVAMRPEFWDQDYGVIRELKIKQQRLQLRLERNSVCIEKAERVLGL